MNSHDDSEDRLMPDQSLYEDLKLLQDKRIFFGHQSVGNNIMQGVKDISTQYADIRLNLIRLNEMATVPPKYFADALIGENTKPVTKCDAFEHAIDSVLRGQVDIALMKFCYVDIREDTDVPGLLRRYETTVDKLSRKHPSTRFVHVTVPLVEQTSGWKKILKRLLRRVDHPDQDNRKRSIFNRMLKERYVGEPIFDLAEVESTHPDGNREAYTLDGQVYYALTPSYALDGSHLNEQGRRIVARALIHQLANIVREMHLVLSSR